MRTKLQIKHGKGLVASHCTMTGNSIRHQVTAVSVVAEPTSCTAGPREAALLALDLSRRAALQSPAICSVQRDTVSER